MADTEQVRPNGYERELTWTRADGQAYVRLTYDTSSKRIMIEGSDCWIPAAALRIIISKLDTLATRLGV